MFLLICLLLIGAAVLFYLYQTRNHSYWAKRGVPSASGLHWFYGHFKSAMYGEKHFCQVAQEIYNEYDLPYIGYMNFSKPGLLLKDPELIKAVLTTDFNSFNENEFKVDNNHDFLMGYNPFFLQGEEWKMSRGHASPMTTFAKLKTYYPNMVKVADNMVEYIKNQNNNGLVDMETRELAGMFTTDVVANALLGIQNDIFKDKNSLFGELNKNLLATGVFEGVRTVISLMCPKVGQYFGMRFSSKQVEDVLMPLTRNIIKEREQTGEVRNDIFQQIVVYKQNDKLGVFTDKYIASQCYGFLLDGYETSSNALCFALFELAWHQDIQDKLRGEINILLNNNNNELTIDHIDKFKYLDMIVSESLRKFPPISMLFKSCTTEYALSKSLTIKKDIKVIIPVSALHMDEKYFPEPEKFDPERFTDEAVAKRDKFVYLPFGEGPRKCVGMRFGVLQVKLAITSIVRHFKILPSPKSSYPVSINPAEFLIKPLNGGWVQFEPLN